MRTIDQLERLTRLREQGAISQEEFEELKKQILVQETGQAQDAVPHVPDLDPPVQRPVRTVPEPPPATSAGKKKILLFSGLGLLAALGLLYFLLLAPQSRSSSGSSNSAMPWQGFAHTGNPFKLTNEKITGNTTKFNVFSNEKFAYSIYYPPSIVTPQKKEDEGDGKLFFSKYGQISLHVRSRDKGPYTLQTLMEEEISRKPEGKIARYKYTQEGFFVLSGLSGNKVFYTKTVQKGESFKTFTIMYPATQKALMDPITMIIANSFR